MADPANRCENEASLPVASALTLHFASGEKEHCLHYYLGPHCHLVPGQEAFGPSDPSPTQPSVFLCLGGRGGQTLCGSVYF